MAIASILAASLASGWNSTMAARAEAKASLAAALVSFCSALSMAGRSTGSWVLNTDCAASVRLAGSGDSRVRLRDRGLHRTAQPVVETNGVQGADVVLTGGAGGGVDAVPSGCLI